MTPESGTPSACWAPLCGWMPGSHDNPKQHCVLALHALPACSHDMTQMSEYPQTSDEQQPDAHGEPSPPQPPPASGGVEPESGGVLPASGGQQAALFWPQLSRQLALHPVGVQQLVLKHSSMPGHVCGHGTSTPQLFMTETWHRPPHAVVSSGGQHVSVLSQYSPPSHAIELSTPQFTVRLQLLTADPHCLPAHVVATGSGMHPQAPL